MVEIWNRTTIPSSHIRRWNGVRSYYCLPRAAFIATILALQMGLWMRLQSVFHESMPGLPDTADRAAVVTVGHKTRVAAATIGPPVLSNQDEPLVLPKLGVLLDAGRHDFSVDWVHRLLDAMAVLGLSILHVRLSDDQRLVDPTVAATTYWSDIVRYARNRSVQILPELDLPSHALAWGDLAVACPILACRTAFGIPLNVSHPMLWEKLEALLQWMFDTFDEPELWHMGGDEVHVNGGQCVEEATGGMLHDQDYEAFERSLGALLESKFRLGPERVLRWETTDPQGRPHYRYGNHTHYWSTMPITTLKNAIVSTGLYWDVLNERTGYEPDAYRVYTIGRRYRHQRAIIAGTFELDAELWRDRNVMGKLVAMSLMPHDFHDDEYEFERAYNATCRTILPESTCARMGRPLVSNNVYRAKHMALWSRWKREACQKTQ
jgi:hypothetical protein